MIDMLELKGKRNKGEDKEGTKVLILENDKDFKIKMK
jgi:hypothetical protein